MSSRVAEESAPYGQTSVAAEQRVVLHNISWETYERLLEETGDERRSLMAFDGGNLEIMSPQAEHEGSNRLIDRMIYILADETRTRIKSVGSLTCKNALVERGLEPDSCYYIQNLAQIRGLKKIDLKLHPAPDLMLEVDITRSSVDKLAICASLKVPEIWRFNGAQLRIFTLKDGSYVESEFSLAFPTFPLRVAIPKFIEREAETDELDALRDFRTWVKQQLEARK